MSSISEDIKLPLPNFLKIFTSNGVPIPKAMEIAGKIYKEHNTPAALGKLNDAKLKTLGVDNIEDRKMFCTALRKGGYSTKNRRKAKESPVSRNESTSRSPGTSEPSMEKLTPVEILTTPTKRKRKQVDDINEFLPSEPPEESLSPGSLEFNEIMDEEILMSKFAIINRAPVMMTWATLVAERMHFSREEALSIASVYTEMNAVTKGVSLGIYDKDRARGSEATKSGSQPYVELMGRRYLPEWTRVPLYRNKAGQWRALSNGKPVSPLSAFEYISRSFRQTTQHIVGALKLLADSYTPEQLNQTAWGLYAEFRPAVNEWGSRSEVRCKTILGLRRKTTESTPHTTTLSETQKSVINDGAAEVPVVRDSNSTPHKKTKLAVEEYEAMLDQDTTFDNVDLDFADIISTSTMPKLSS